MTWEFVKTRVTERVGWLEYQRPPRNEFDWKMLGEVPAALDAFLHDPDVRVVVFASALEKYFSVGADLRVLEAMKPDDMRKWVQTCHALVRQMRDAEKPLLGAIHGTAVGAGLEIVLNCDVRFAAADARLGQPEVASPSFLPWARRRSSARLLGRPRALRFLYDGTLVPAEEARQMGLVDIVVSPERLREEVQAYGVALARKPADSRGHPALHRDGPRAAL